MSTPHYEDDLVTLHHGDCIAVLRELPDNSVDAVVTDPPYGLEFMGKDWDAPWQQSDVNADAGFNEIAMADGATRLPRPSFTGSTNPKCLVCKGTRRGRRDGTAKVAVCLCEDGGQFPNVRAVEMKAFQTWCTEWATECLRVLKPGGHILAFGGSRTWHRLAAAVEDAGFEIRDSIAWLYSQGFPKSMNVGSDQRFCQCGVGESRGGSEARFDSVEQVGSADLSGVREGVPSSAGKATRRTGSDVLAAVSGEAGLGSTPGDRGDRPGGMDGQLARELRDEDERRPESGLEGRGDAQASAGELRPLADGALPAGVRGDVQGERLRADPSARDGAVDRTSVDANGVRESHRPRHVEQRAVEPGAVADESRPQAGRGRSVCGGCGKPQVTGWGTALKPAFEPIVVGRKPLAGTVAANVLEHGTGALNIDACRVAGDNPSIARRQGSTNHLSTRPAAESEAAGRIESRTSPERYAEARAGEELGRWPTNVLLDDHQAAELDKQSGVLTSGLMPPGTPKQGKSTGILGEFKPQESTSATYGDTGGASRFFPVFRYQAKAPTAERPNVDGVQHPTVKPLDLMRWLVRLVTPPGAIVLEPFAGSGTTAEACVLEDRRCIAIEREADYLPLIVSRLRKPQQRGLFGVEEAS